MGLFSRRKPDKNDGLRTQAENLVTAAEIQATAAYTSVGDRFNLVYSISTDRWDSVLTVAGVFIAATRANQIDLPDAQIDSLMEIVASNLNSWRPEGVAAFEDCKAFFDQTFDALEKDPSYRSQSELVASDALGGWIVWNLVEHAPESEQERGLVRTLGILLTHSFFGWWSDQPAA
jgi:fructose-1,6-bisphosphatase